MLYLPCTMEDICFCFFSNTPCIQGLKEGLCMSIFEDFFWASKGAGGNGPSGSCHGHGHRCFNWKWSPRLQLAEKCKKNAALDPIKASTHEYVISAMSVACNGSTEYACSEACNSEFRDDLFRSKRKLNEKICSLLGFWKVNFFFFF